MRALIVGATGFIGSHVVKRLLSRGFHVRALVRNNGHQNHLVHKDVELIYGDVLDRNSLRNAADDVDLVYSVFGLLGLWGIPDHIYREINVYGVRNLLDACLGKNVKQFIHVSSAGVLGPLSSGVIADETFPLNPSNIYETTKCEAEKEVVDFNRDHGIPFTIIRPEFVYGPGDSHVLGLFRSIRDKKFALIGKGESLLHPTYIDDLVQGIIQCTSNEKAVGQIYLMTGSRPYPVREIAQIISEELDVDLLKLDLPIPLALFLGRVLELSAKVIRFEPPLNRSRVKFFSQNRAFSFQKAHKELEYDPQVEFREGVKRTVKWYRDNKCL